MSKTNTFSLYLVKKDVTEFDDLLTEAARKLLANGSADKTRSSDFGEGAVLYTFPGYRHVPRWADQLRTVFSFPENLYAQSPSAILAFKKQGAIFALTFAFGHVYLDAAKTQMDFGLKVAINAVSEKKLRSVERSNIGDAIRDLAQAARQRDLRSFGFDDALDLIRKVSGYTDDNEFADRVTGSRALRFSKKMDLGDVPDSAAESLSLFASKAYKKTAFGIVDFLSPVSDPTAISKLVEALVWAIRDGTDEFEVTIPAILPENVGSFRFEHARLSEFHPDLSLELYRVGLGRRLDSLTLEDLKRHQVAAYSEDDNQPIDRWSLHRSLVGSLIFDDERYALNEGSWYRVDQKFKEAADTEFAKLCTDPDKKLRPLKKIYPPAGRRSGQKPAYQSEKSYNEEIAKEAGYLLLDGKLIPIEGVPGPGLEACDLLDVPGRRLIHVKKSSRQSSVLSHLFKQGSNSSQMIKRYDAFKRGIVATVRTAYGEPKGSELEDAFEKDWTVDFRIADFPRESGDHNIPFFSKLTLRDEARRIRAMGFDVQVGFITLTRA